MTEDTAHSALRAPALVLTAIIMDNGTSQPANKNLVPQHKVDAWRIHADTRNQTGIATGIIGFLFDGLVGFLQTVLNNMRQGDVATPWYGSLEKNAAALLFWGLDHSVSKGELDTTLQHSGLLRDTVLLVLISIGEFISESTPVHSSAHQNSN
jgi:hypothetical protein